MRPGGKAGKGGPLSLPSTLQQELGLGGGGGMGGGGGHRAGGFKKTKGGGKTLSRKEVSTIVYVCVLLEWRSACSWHRSDPV